MQSRKNIGKLTACGSAALAAGLCLALACPAVLASSSAPSSYAYADGSSTSSVEVSGEIKPVHEHRKECVPTSENLARYATVTAPARYHYVCRCGKQFRETYEYGYPLTGNLAQLKRRYADSPKGGIAFTGSSLFSRWDSVAADIEDKCVYPANMVYNMAMGGTNVYRWAQDDYIDAIAALEPSVVVVSGINSLRYFGSLDTRNDLEAADETAAMIETYVEKLEPKLPSVKVLVVGGIKTPDDYRREYLAGTKISSWKRIDLYNKLLKKEFRRDSSVTYVDIQQQLLTKLNKPKHGQTFAYYCNKKKLRDKSSLKTARKIVMAKCDYEEKLDPYFKADLRHPSALSYSKIWLPRVGAKAVQLARSSGKGEFGGQVR